MSETETIARNLSGELARHRKTQAALAKELGVSEQNISKRLQGEGSFTTEQLEKTAAMLGMSLYQLMLKLLQPIDGINQIKP
ncbi:helix-turn-helix transcriptional regulator [Bifidobacterium adolescentis]|uniref:helix-turn-helix transcriptional regulator n=1 Tax=Bifidobacterium adolescentis TaxID=1680 RepID=UPI00189F7EAC|nr:helix-turn-helix transcriptional regulator [Bifidobacterium adolescentis]MDB0585674.1 helix-turn-helix transcriptional regulator [Bifidobacterium adolescentis]MDB0587553.1 helix-turn-helix transcriptional regulator [Bifidobacterium adolescentis]MDB0617753.1 helix-turn-helix transcriptional regulator [Bifidobacterium adolescentis]MDB0621409.1 helix-turn-helix transcriptional regulator [Bifidobacterium adolescentis]MDB0622617.1 helix-turn-helix transcriptional regulator [Bifidobacterium adole